jgi:hypothetical protein
LVRLSLFCCCLSREFPVIFPSYFRHISVEFPVVFPPYVTMVWYLFLVKAGIIQVLWLFWTVRWSLRPSLWWLRCCSGRISGSCGWVVWLCEVKQATFTCEMPDFPSSRYNWVISCHCRKKLSR